MFDFETEITLRRQEREREVRALLTAAEASGRRKSVRAPAAAALARLALALHRDTAADVVLDARERAGQPSA